VSPIVFVLLAETVIRVGGIDTDLARNDNFEIAVPVWMLADENRVDIQRGRLARSSTWASRGTRPATGSPCSSTTRFRSILALLRGPLREGRPDRGKRTALARAGRRPPDSAAPPSLPS